MLCATRGDVAAVAGWLGHAGVRTTMQIYALLQKQALAQRALPADDPLVGADPLLRSMIASPDSPGDEPSWPSIPPVTAQ
jgi:hypothetical protein